jgi:filamentous hemagglutinin
VQGLGANQVKQIADSLGSEEARAALHAIVGCAGAAASSQSCGAGAMGAASSSVLGSLLAPAKDLSATEREARDNLVTNLVAGVASITGANATTAGAAGKIEVENNQLGPGTTSQPVPPWLPGLIKLPGFTGQSRNKGDGVIVDPATELDPSAKAGSLIYPMPGAKTLNDFIAAIIPDQAKWLENFIINSSRLPSANKERLNFDSKIEAKDGGYVNIELSSRQKFDKNGSVVDSQFAQSDLIGRYSPSGNLHIDWYGTTVGGKGVGTEMISKAISSVGSDKVKTVTAQLGNTNRDVYDSASSSGLSSEKAAWSTPLGKSMKELGFTKVEVNGYSVKFHR